MKASRVRGTAGVLFFFAIFLLLVQVSLMKVLDHDEYVYTTSGKLLADKGLIPHRDYAYIHLPNLTFAYAALYAWTDHLLLAGRMFSVLSSFALLVLVFFTALHFFRGRNETLRFCVAAGAVLCLAMNPLFIYTVGEAWNQDPSVFLSVLAAVMHCGALRSVKPIPWLAASGACLGLAIGTRLTHAPAVAAFAGALLLLPNVHLREQWKRFAVFGTALLIALLPTVFIMAADFGRFMFDNLDFQRLSAHFRQATGYREAMTLRGKVDFLSELLHEQPATLLLFVSFAVLTVRTVIVAVRQRSSGTAECIFLIALVPALFIGSFAPTPSWEQYYYQPIPVIVLAVVCMLASIPAGEDRNWAMSLCAAAAAVSVYFAYFDYRATARPGRFTPMETHVVGQEIRQAVGHGKVLTLAPLFPLEGGLEIYDEFATGFVMWRSAPFLSPEKRRRFRIISNDELCGLLARDRPRSVLLGFEPSDQERPLAVYAGRNGYRAKVLSNGMTLWVAPDSFRGAQVCGPE